MNDSGAIAGPLGLAWAIPFLGLLVTIALLPLAAPLLWHRHYGKFATLWALAFIVPDFARRGAYAGLATFTATALLQYLPFILLLGALFAVAGGLRVTGAPRPTPAINTAYLAASTVMASVIGAPAASVVLIGPLIRANRARAYATHVFVFFILLVANVGGALTPLGNPPLFLGYLLGVPFFWPATHLFLPTITVAGGLLAVFFALDWAIARGTARRRPPTHAASHAKLALEGGINLVLIVAAVGAILLQGVWHPAAGLRIMGIAWSLGEIASAALLLGVAVLSLWLTPRRIRSANHFTWQPLIEVAILFAAIFITLQPVMAMIAEGKDGPAAPLIARLFDGTPNVRLFYWATGALSAFLDNAPSYVVFFDFGRDGAAAADMTGKLAPVLIAISAGAVYFGALSYIGNATNFMVKAMVESQGLKMPGFFAYLGWACVFLLPWLALVDALFLGGK